ncbi:AbrB family transcriptional regulator [Aquibacillus kalidii]|uniref:AbrB family transcriptional regulator n=1 Tax=Aquibacillus kalidii TaxID=2762597 RepID=UPI0016468A75|nr:AbrB family transcriptional regulator [Aquibacillus kalidii]
MKTGYLSRVLFTYVVGLIGASLFVYLHLPLPWILGPLLSILLMKSLSPVDAESSSPLRKVSFTITGIQIGATFTATTIDQVLPYFIPYTILTLLLITISLVNAYWLTKWIPIDPTTSMLGSVPGGLSVIVALSDSLKGNTALVAIFHTIRLMSVLFLVPFVVTHLFSGNDGVTNYIDTTTTVQGPLWTILLLFLFFIIALLVEHKVPASLVIVPMLLVAFFQINSIELYHLPEALYLFAQLTIGIHLGTTISIRDLIKAGKYCVYYLGLTVLLIGISFGFGYLFSLHTNMDLATAILSFAPGGLIEMALTAHSVKGDPSVVGSLQMIRMLTIVVVLPLLLKTLLPKLIREKNTSKS